MSRKYFGTDGVRGRVGEHPITPQFVMHLGYAAGKVLAEALRGQAERFDAFADLPHYPFPGGQMLRTPLTALGAWYYSLRDRLGF